MEKSMIGSVNHLSAPPLNDAAVAAALTLLAVAADPEATRTRLAELQEQETKVRAAIEEHSDAQKRSEQAAAELVDLTQREKRLAEKEAEVTTEYTRATNASAATANRTLQLDQRAQALDQREAQLDRREADLAARLETYRKALA
jgi:uncharacterized protein (DUF3084 family)